MFPHYLPVSYYYVDTYPSALMHRLAQITIASWLSQSFTKKTDDEKNISASAWKTLLLKEDIVFELDYTSERDFDVESSTGIVTIIKRYWWAIDPRLYRKQTTSSIFPKKYQHR